MEPTAEVSNRSKIAVEDWPAIEMDPIYEHFDEVMTFRETLANETDRGVALVCAAYLDEELRTLLKKSFVDAPTTARRLLEGTGALSSFSARIDIAYVSGLLAAESHGALHVIRKIRNGFAHESRKRSFTDQDISDRCRELIPLSPLIRDKNPRDLFIRAALTVLAGIHAKTMKVSHADAQQDPPLDSARADFDELRNILVTIVAELTGDELLQLVRAETKTVAKKRLVLEAFKRAGF